jgi:uncharacterized protein (TIRG00374 family)
MTVAVSVVLPAYDEADTLADTVDATLDTLAGFLPEGTYEVLIAEDGCTDATPDVAARLAAEHEHVRHVHSDERLGRGRALERAFRAADGDTLAYLDTDLATDMRHLEPLIESIRSGDAEVATGSRWIPGEVVDRPTSRAVPSRVFNGLVRGLLRSRLRDHQCGFKAFDRDALFDLLPADDDHWFWDTEVLVRAQRAGYRVHEFPVEWTPMGDTTVDPIRDVVGMGGGILRTFWTLDVRPRIDRRVSVAAGLLLGVLALALMTVYLDPEAVLAELAGVDPWLAALAAVVYTLSWPLRGRRYRDILSTLGFREGTGFLTGAVFISQTGNLVFPARAGDAVRAYVVKARRGVPYPTGFASLAVERAFDLLTIAAIALTGLAGVALAVGRLPGAAAAGVAPAAFRTAITVAVGVAAATLVAVLLLVATGRSERNLIRGVVGRVSSDAYADLVVGWIERFVADLRIVARDRRAALGVAATSALIWLLDVATAAIVLLAFGVDIAPAPLLAVSLLAVSVGNLAKVLPLSPGGVGLYEAAFTGLVVGLTPIGGATAFGAAVVDHAIKNLVTVVGGVGSMLALNVSLTRAADRGEVARGVSDEPDGAD